MIFSKNRVLEVVKYYQNWTQKYIKSFGDTFQSHRPDNLEEYFNYLKHAIDINDSMLVVDAGCGVGGPLFSLAKFSNSKFIGVNISADQIEIAEKRNAEENLDNLEFVLADFHNLSAFFEPASIDRVFFLESLVHSDKADKVIKEVYKILKPYGKIYIKDLYERVPLDQEDKKKIKESILINNKLFKMSIDTKENTLMMLRENGFKLDFCKLLEIEANQDLGNKFVLDNNIVSSLDDWHPYLEWYEIKATKIHTIYDW